MSQAEPYEVIVRTSEGVKRGRNFATLKAARAEAKRMRARGVEGVTIVQRKKGHAGYTVIEGGEQTHTKTLADGTKLNITTYNSRGK